MSKKIKYIIETFEMFATALSVTEEEIEALEDIKLIPILQLSKDKGGMPE